MIHLLAQRLRRDAVQLTLWIVGISALAYMGYVAGGETFATEQDRASLLAAAIANPVILLFRGLPSGSSEGALVIFLILPATAFLAALMSTFLAVRHTRGDEEAGRAELVSATPVSRTRPLVATAIHGLAANLVLALLVSAAFVASGLGVDGAFVAGFAVGGVGVAFLGAGLLAAQLMRTSRGANASSVWTVTVLFFVCGLGNALGTPSDDLQRMESSWLTWLSPFGWAENTRAYDENNPWPLLLLLALGLVLTGVSVALLTVRDLGEGLVASRRGRAAAGATLGSPIGLVWRLTRGGILGWVIGGLAVGAMATSLASVVDEFSAENPAIEQLLSQIAGSADTEQATVAAFFTILGVLAASCAVQIVIRARQEEAGGTVEPVLSAPVARVRWLSGYVLMAVIGVALTVGAAVVAATAGVIAQDSDRGLIGDVLIMGAGQFAAALVFVAIAAAVFVAAPRLTIPLSWSLVLVSLLLGFFGPLFGFPEALVDLSPIAAAPGIAGDDIDLGGLWWLASVTVLGIGGALTLMRRRELAAAG